jgi:uncharacterized membrane protein YsdA (DUF1294 family)
MYKYILIYFLIINLFGIIINCADKIKAKHNKWRIRESTLWITGLIGGATGSYLTMKIIRHKTKHKNFMIIMPLLMIIQIFAMAYLYFYLQ